MKDKENIYIIALASIITVLFLIITLSTASGATEQNAWPKITETRITTSGFAESPDIYGDRIVWHDLNNSIYMYNLSTHKKTQVPTNAPAYYSAIYPAIYDDRIVWTSDRNIYLYNLSTSKETQITTSKTAYNPAIYDDRIVWEDYRNGNNIYNIYMYNLSTSQETQITTSEIAYDPDIYGDRIVWRNGLSENAVVYIYDLSTPKITRITTAKSNQIQPSIYNDRIVWLDNRNDNNGDIYMGTISGFKTLVANFSSNVTGGFPPLFLVLHFVTSA